MRSALFVRLLAASLLMFASAEFASAQQDVPIETYASNTIAGSDPVDPLWLNFCLGEGFQGAGQITRTGTATHLGKYISRERFCLDFTMFPLVRSRNIEITLIAANMDQLFVAAEADFDYTNPAAPVVTDSYLEFVGGTGRFMNATGTGGIAGVEVTAEGIDILHLVGTISYEASDRRH